MLLLWSYIGGFSLGQGIREVRKLHHNIVLPQLTILHTGFTEIGILYPTDISSSSSLSKGSVLSHLLAELWATEFFKWKWVNKRKNKFYISPMHLLTSHYRNWLRYHFKRKKVILYSDSFWKKSYLILGSKQLAMLYILFFHIFYLPRRPFSTIYKRKWSTNALRELISMLLKGKKTKQTQTPYTLKLRTRHAIWMLKNF